jgi:hypothetical protein
MGEPVQRAQIQELFGRPPAASPRPDRTGRNVIERQAVALVAREIAAMPASLVVQLALWPDEIASWARAEHTSESLVYNMLAHRKPYFRVRDRLAERLGVPVEFLAHLIAARRPLPTAKRGPDDRHDPADGPPIDWGARPIPMHRDGTNPIERRAVRSVEADIAAMPASAVVGLALWPETLAEWSREQRFKSSVVWATLSGSPSERVRGALARRLAVPSAELEALIVAVRVEPRARRPVLLADAAPTGEPAEGGAPRDVVPDADAAPAAGDQMSLDL